MITLSEYNISYDRRRSLFLVISREPLPVCSRCGCELRAFGYRLRRVIGGDGTPRMYELQRLRCDGCRTVQLWLPSFIKAGKYYSAQTITAALSGSRGSCPADDSTIRRWKREERERETLQPVLPVNQTDTVLQYQGTAKKENR